MKFNTLVVAAMVITSVNAGGHKRVRGWFARRGGMSKDKPQDYWITKEKQDTGSNASESHPICDPIALKLDGLRLKIKDRSNGFWKYMPLSPRLLQTGDESGNVNGDYRRNKNDQENELKIKERQDPFTSYRINNPKLKKIKTEITGLKKKYSRVWTKFEKAKCSTKHRQLVSPEEITKIIDPFLK
ncbi:hypothetical protein BASA81_013068 [Batrachochytrium salamandrivorans]|nr:hypothetical protein BASA81_013068 [Batrachochytrium salamandrivorans]